MNIIIINGSLRINGSTGKILTKIQETLAKIKPDINIEYVDLANMDLQFCTGCASCYSTGICPIKDDGLEELSRRIEAFDGVIFGSPTFASNVTGRFKVLIDRGHFIFEQLLKDKACFSVVTYENYGGSKALRVINELIHFSGGAVSGKYLVKINHNEPILNDKRNQQIEKLCRKYLNKAKQMNPLSLREKIMRFFVFHAGIKPYVLKNEIRFKGVYTRWVKKGLVPERN